MFAWVLGVVEGGGYIGIFFLMILENIFPPIPSEAIIPLAGFLAAEGRLDITLVILVSTLGTLVGCLFWYAVGRAVGLERIKWFCEKYGRITTLSPQEVDTAQVWFTKYGAAAVFFGRLIPGVRTLISIPAGIAGMPLLPFLFYSTLGSIPWILILAALGYVLQSNYAQVEAYLDPVSTIVLGLIVLYYLYRVITYKTKR